MSLQYIVTTEVCDKCGHTARVRAQHNGRELTFCQHHANENQLALILAGWYLTQIQEATS